ncbi:EmrB/QacA subfamily drug resistance transporter [Actinoplanes tereljensis]|uniref:MFS transporter n=1 Tax=Paractinoplanes tereljensis TaxID=571912 RepID=A0A919TVI8_9ACTN|nr:DHA2 family efflux MFS transporter permease subunit [Actinoplanes tereljensis]GIF22385.1 MFS transporter [Actinoplanes tereljensis]
MRRPYLVLAICCMSLFIVGMDATIMNIALPALREDLGASISGLQWTIDAYTLVLASLLVLSGSTADRVGRRRTFQTGLALFSAGSLLCSLAPSLGWLIAFRAVQAIGGSMLNPVAMSIITNTFTEPRERARAIGVWGGVVGFSMAVGPLLGGFLVDTLGWRSIFWINVPVGVAAFLLAWKFVPESRAPKARRLDPVGQVLVFLTLAGVTYGIIEGPTAGWSSPLIVGCFLVGAASLAGLLIYEPRQKEPLLELRFFRSVPFSGATLIAVSAFGALAGFLFLNSIYLQDTRGLSPLHAGLWTLPMAATTALFSPISGRLVGARGTRLPLTLAGVAFVAGLLPLTRLTADTPVWLLMVCYVLFGFGFAMVNSPITNTAVSGMPREQAGVAAAIASTSRQVGGALGVAVIGAAVAGNAGAGFAEASHAGWWIMSGLGAAVLVLGLVTTGKWARGTVERAAVQTSPAEAAKISL